MIDILLEIWRSLYKKTVDSDWSVVCVGCGMKMWGNEPDIGIECIDCFKKSLQDSIVLTVHTVQGVEQGVYEVYDAPARENCNTVGFVYNEPLALELAALARLHASKPGRKG